jgi:hypothetical protein
MAFLIRADPSLIVGRFQQIGNGNISMASSARGFGTHQKSWKINASFQLENNQFTAETPLGSGQIHQTWCRDQFQP